MQDTVSLIIEETREAEVSEHLLSAANTNAAVRRGYRNCYRTGAETGIEFYF